MQGLDPLKNPAEAVDMKKNSCWLEKSHPPPITLLMVRPYTLAMASLSEVR